MNYKVVDFPLKKVVDLKLRFECIHFDISFDVWWKVTIGDMCYGNHDYIYI